MGEGSASAACEGAVGARRQQQIIKQLEDLQAIKARLTTIEQTLTTVPDYGQAILDGAEIGRQMATGRD